MPSHLHEPHRQGRPIGAVEVQSKTEKHRAEGFRRRVDRRSKPLPGGNPGAGNGNDRRTLAAFNNLSGAEKQRIMITCRNLRSMSGSVDPGLVSLCKLLNATAMR